MKEGSTWNWYIHMVIVSFFVFPLSLTHRVFYHMSLQIVFVENKKLRSTLLGDIDESQLPDTYGGKLPLVPIQDC